MVRKAAFIASLIVFSCNIAFANPQTYTATGEYVMSPKETLEDGIKHAREDALRLISESVGVFVESQSEAKNQELTQDEIKTMSTSIIRVKSESAPTIIQHGQGLDIKLTVTAEADADELFTKKQKENQELIVQNVDLQSQVFGANLDAAYAFDSACQAYSQSDSFDNIKNIAGYGAESDNLWKSAYAKKWLGIVAFHDGRYEDGLKLCEEAVDILEKVERDNMLGIDSEPSDLLNEMAYACAYWCGDADRAEEYMKKADKLSEECVNRFASWSAEESRRNAEKSIQELRTNGEVSVHTKHGTPLELMLLG